MTTLWFGLWGVLWALYFVTDGFDLGVGMLYPFLGRDAAHKAGMLGSIAPVWNGNEVWLITAAGATFAAFPGTYALMFSYLYTPLLLILFGLILRGVALEFRYQTASPRAQRAWDGVFFAASLVTTLLFGVTFGNIFQGLPMDATGYHGTFLSLWNPYALVTGVCFVLLFSMHGLSWLALRAQGALARQAALSARAQWPFLGCVAAVFLIHTALATDLYANFLKIPLLFLVPAAAVAGLFGQRVGLSRGFPAAAFAASAVTILAVVFTGFIGLYPRLIPSSLDPAASLTIFNTAASPYTLTIMAGVAAVFVPLVIAYQVWIYRVFQDCADGDAASRGPDLKAH